MDSGSEFRVQGSGLRISGFRVQGSGVSYGFRVQVVGFRVVMNYGSRVVALRCRVYHVVSDLKFERFGGYDTSLWDQGV